MPPGISIRGFVRPSVHPSVRPSIHGREWIDRRTEGGIERLTNCQSILFLFRLQVCLSLLDLKSTNQFHRRDQRKMRLNYSCVHLSIPFYPRRDRQEKDYHRHRPNWQDSSSIQDLVTVSDSPRPPSTGFFHVTNNASNKTTPRQNSSKKKSRDTVSLFGLLVECLIRKTD